jgi:sporulation integral membrane protein YtvI
VFCESRPEFYGAEVIPTDSEDSRKKRFILNCAYYAVILIIGYLIVKYLLGWIMPFLIGFILAAAVQPAARFCHKKNGANVKACSVAGVLLLVALLLLLMVFGTAKLVRDLYAAANQLPAVIDSLMRALDRISLKLSPFLFNVQSNTGIKIDTSLSGISNQLLKLSQLPEGAVNLLQSAASSLPSFFLNIVVSVVAACFIAADYSHVTGFLLRLLPQRHRETARGIKDFFFTTVVKLIRAYLTLMFITFCELLVGLALLHIKNPAVIAAAIAIVDILPVLGTGTVMIPWAFTEFIMGNAYLGVSLLLLYAVITVVRNILEPKIVGNHIGLHPLVTLTAIIVGLKALGVAGMIIFPISIIIIKRLYENGVIKLWRDA